MSTSRRNVRALAALLIGFVAIASACVQETPPPYYGIYFYPPASGYLGKAYTLKANATSGLPVTFTLDASSTACNLVNGTLIYTAVGDCVVNADQAGDATHAASAQIRRTIKVYNCPPLRSGIWSGPLGLSANVIASGSSFTGSVDLSSLGYGVQTFGGTVACEVASMTFNNTPLTGYLSPDGSTLSSNYNGIDIVLTAPPAAA